MSGGNFSLSVCVFLSPPAELTGRQFSIFH
jgi:hypothetical protein